MNLRTCTAALAALLLSCLSAVGQYTNQGPVNTAAQNSTIYVGAVPGLFPTIQASVAKACAAGAKRVVDIPAGYTGVDSPTAVTGGCTTAWIFDDRAVLRSCYVWNGTAYASTPCGSGGGSSPTGTPQHVSGFGADGTITTYGFFTDSATKTDLTGIRNFAARTVLGSPNATGYGSVTAALAACAGVLNCLTTVDPAYQGFDYMNLGTNPGGIFASAPGLHLLDNRGGQTSDYVADVSGSGHTFGTVLTRQPLAPLSVTLTRAGGVVTIANAGPQWCGHKVIIFSAGDSSFSSPIDSGSGNAVDYYQNGGCSATSFSFNQAGANGTTTGMLTAYPNADANLTLNSIIAGRGWYGYGGEALSQATNRTTYLSRKSLAHGEGENITSTATGDFEGKYLYDFYMQQGGGNGDDENTYNFGDQFNEIGRVMLGTITSLGSSNNKIYFNQTQGGYVGGGHYLLVTTAADGSTSAAFDAGNITAIDPTPPASLGSDFKLLTVSSTVPVSTAWGTFTNVNTPVNYDFGVAMTTTLTQTGGAGTPSTGWFCLTANDRNERVYLTVTGSGPYSAAGTFRNYFKSGTPRWMQGGLCTSPIGGGVVAMVAGAVNNPGLAGTAQVLPIMGSTDVHTVIYSVIGNGAKRSLLGIASNLLPEVFTAAQLSRSGNVVTLQPLYGLPFNWCEKSGLVISAATDASFNGTFTPTCLNSAAGYTWTQTGANATGVTATATMDRGREAIAFYPAEEVVTNVDESAAIGTSVHIGSFVQTAPTDLAFAVGQTIGDYIGGYAPAANHVHYQTCYSAGCKGEVLRWGGPGARGGTDINGVGFLGLDYANLNPQSMYQQFGGNSIEPTFMMVGGIFKTLFDLNNVYAGGAGMIPGGVLFNIPCPQRDVSTLAPCASPHDRYAFLQFATVHGGSGGGPAGTWSVNPANSSIDLTFEGGSPPAYIMGDNGWNFGVTTHPLNGSIYGNLSLSGGQVSFLNGLTVPSGQTALLDNAIFNTWTTNYATVNNNLYVSGLVNGNQGIFPNYLVSNNLQVGNGHGGSLTFWDDASNDHYLNMGFAGDHFEINNNERVNIDGQGWSFGPIVTFGQSPVFTTLTAIGDCVTVGTGSTLGQIPCPSGASSAGSLGALQLAGASGAFADSGCTGTSGSGSLTCPNAITAKSLVLTDNSVNTFYAGHQAAGGVDVLPGTPGAGLADLVFAGGSWGILSSSGLVAPLVTGVNLSATVAVSEMAAGTCTSYTVTLTGLRTGMKIGATGQSDPAAGVTTSTFYAGTDLAGLKACSVQGTSSGVNFTVWAQ